MENELQISNIDINYLPPKVTLENKEELLKMAKMIGFKYKSTIATEETKKSDKKLLAKLRTLDKQIDQKRINFHKEYEKPYETLKFDLDTVRNEIYQATLPLSKSLDDLAAQQREDKKGEVQKLIDEMAPNYDIDPATVEIEKKWTNSSMGKLELTRILKDGFTAIQNKNKLFQANKKLIEERCKSLDVESGGWLSQFDEDTDVESVLTQITNFAHEKESKQVQEEKQAEAEKAVRDANIKLSNNKLVDENGEIVGEIAKEYEVTLSIKGTRDLFDKLFDFLQTNEAKFETKNKQVIGEVKQYANVRGNN
ncbi:DUF1351 domain-containing protein [Companilactobacillus mishanensis]|nr:DUF1351 domain-containing protein [Companilactobacillus mishanensis]